MMLFPLAWMATALGAVLGWSITAHGPSAPDRAGPALGALLLPLALVADLAAPPPPLTEVMTAVDIDAPPEVVWERVVAFGRIEGEPEWFFRMGLAYPVEATIDGTGIGAVRRCSFSTGDFVEPITAWEFPHRLAFDVAEQPAPLHEWSPYGALYTPHLEGYFRSVRGEFRLIALPGERTRLEGSTWYALDMAPLVYWRPFAEGILHRIHGRVLGQVKREAEGA